MHFEAVNTHGEAAVLIGLLEWVCGGGLIKTPDEEIPQSLAREGGLMAVELVRDLADCGYQVTTVFDRRMQGFLNTHRLNGIDVHWISASQEQANAEVWLGIFRNVDSLLVVAPECGGELQKTLAAFRARGIDCVNCSADFLGNSCDKWLTSQCLAMSGLAHPPTQRCDRVTDDWLRSHRHATDHWAIKPRDGAGCDGLLRLSTDEVLRHLDSHRSHLENSIIQPWIDGTALSRSAIVDRAGQARWLPLVTQDLRLGRNPVYLGGSVLAGDRAPLQSGPLKSNEPVYFAADTQVDLVTLLDRTLIALGSGARGWVGVDLVFDTQCQRFTIIEINPRLTTSFIGLNRSYGGRLAGNLFADTLANVAMKTNWRSQNFRCGPSGSRECI